MLNATHEFEVFCENEDIREIWSAAQKERYFKQEERKYYFCVLGIRRKVRGMILNLIPEVVKERRRAKIINENGEG